MARLQPHTRLRSQAALLAGSGTLTVPSTGGGDGSGAGEGHVGWNNAAQSITAPYARLDLTGNLATNGFNALWTSNTGQYMVRPATYTHIPNGGFYGRGAGRMVPGYFTGDPGDSQGQHYACIGQIHGLANVGANSNRVTLGVLCRFGSDYFIQGGANKTIIFLRQGATNANGGTRNTRPMVIPQGARDNSSRTILAAACDGTICNTTSNPAGQDYWNDGGNGQPDLKALNGVWQWQEVTIDLSVTPALMEVRTWSANGVHQGTVVRKHLTEDIGGNIHGIDCINGFVNSVANPSASCWSEIELVEIRVGVAQSFGPPPGFPGSTR